MLRIKISISFLVLFFNFHESLLAQDFDVPITVTDGINEQVLTIGVDSSGSDAFDADLDKPAPPPPPSGAFDARLEWMDEHYFTDIRDNTIVEKYFVMKYQPETGGAIVLYWDSASLSALGSFHIVDDLTGELFNLDMTTIDSLAISSSQFITDKLRILLTPAPPVNKPPLISPVPDKYLLYQNFPNPFNPVTKIRYGLPKSGEVKIAIYNLIGQKIAKILDEFNPAGYHVLNFDASNLPSGVYFYRLQAGAFHDVKKMVLLH